MWPRGPRPGRRVLERAELGTGLSGGPWAAGYLDCCPAHDSAIQRPRRDSGAAFPTGLEEPRPGRVDPTLPRPSRGARSSPAEPELLGPIPGDYAREPTNQLHQLMNIYDLG